MNPDRAKLLIVNADDFGITEGATDAIVECHRAGSVTSTTLMTNMPAAQYAAQRAQENPALGVGLHFNLTLGRPLAALHVNSLTDGQGALLSRRDLALRAITGRLRAAEIRNELDAQHAAMRALGLTPTHLDSHQHVHAIPGIFQVVANFAAERGLPMRMPVNASSLPAITLAFLASFAGSALASDASSSSPPAMIRPDSSARK